MWYELRVVLHNRENTMLTLAAHSFARDEVDFTENALNNWISLQNSIENMPLE